MIEIGDNLAVALVGVAFVIGMAAIAWAGRDRMPTAEPECTCYEALGGHELGCPMRQRP